MIENNTIKLDVWNMDETSFRSNCRIPQPVFIFDPNTLFRIIDPDNCDFINLVRCINLADGKILPISLILGINIQHKWCIHNDLDRKAFIGTINTGYSNNDIALKWP